MKITVIGAGNVGATLALRAAEGGLGDVTLIDVVEGLAAGKALDIEDAAPIAGHEARVTGTTDFGAMAGSDIVVITAGLARKPGMSRDDLISKNGGIVRGIALKIRSHCPDAIIIVVTNPLDVMSYLVYSAGGFHKSKVMGMAGTLDTARFRNIIAGELGVRRAEISTCVLGNHGDSMVPLISRTTVKGRPISEVVGSDKLREMVSRTRDRGGRDSSVPQIRQRLLFSERRGNRNDKVR
ncbi:MAG: hypothetical protein ABH885_03190 [Candidatus Omnitrophota bacterium]